MLSYLNLVGEKLCLASSSSFWMSFLFNSTSLLYVITEFSLWKLASEVMLVVEGINGHLVAKRLYIGLHIRLRHSFSLVVKMTSVRLFLSRTPIRHCLYTSLISRVFPLWWSHKKEFIWSYLLYLFLKGVFRISLLCLQILILSETISWDMVWHNQLSDSTTW